MIEEKREKHQENSAMMEERPLTGKGSYGMDELEQRPLTGKGSYGMNEFEERPLTGKGSYGIEKEEMRGKNELIEEKPLSAKGTYNFKEKSFDDQPITAKGAYAGEFDMPLTGKGTYKLNEIPNDSESSSGLKPKNKNSMETEMPIRAKGEYAFSDENEFPGSNSTPLSSAAPKRVFGAQKAKTAAKKPKPAFKMEERNGNPDQIEEETPQEMASFKTNNPSEDIPLTGKGAYSILEEKAVGSGQPSAAGLSEFGTNEPQKAVETGPLSTRVKSKNFHSRMSAFEELKELFENANSADDPIFREYGHEMHKFIGDAMPAPQEKACGALKAFLEKSKGKDTGLNFGLCTKGLLEKCLAGGKPNVIGVANECLVLLFETTDDKPAIFENIIWAVSHKNQKVSVAGIASISVLLTNFGPQKLELLKPFYSHIEKAAANTVAPIRNEAMNFYKEAYKWIGDALKNFMTNLKKTQIDELEKHFAENPRVPMVPLRGGPAIGTGAKASGSAEGASGPVAMMEDIDPYDMANPVDIFKQFNDSWSEKTLAIPKWKDKKDALDEFLKAASAPKIIGNCSHITQMVKKLFMDSNVLIQLCGIKILGSLAKGMRKGFSQGARINIEPVLTKVKDKKPQVVEEAFAALENFFYCITLEEMLEEMKTLSSDKNTSMRVGIMKLGEIYFSKCIGKGPNAQNKVKGAIKGFIPIAKKMLEDSTPDVKEAAISTLRILLSIYDEEIGAMLDDVNQQKLTRIRDMTKLPAAAEGDTKTQGKTPQPGNVPKTPKGPNKSAFPVKEEAKTLKGGSASGTAAKASQNEPNESLQAPSGIPVDEAEALLTGSGLPETGLTQIYHQNWKEKIGGIEAFRTVFNEQPAAFKSLIEPTLAIFKKALKNWKESTLMLNKEVFGFLCEIIQNPEANLTRGSWSLAVELVVEKSIDSKFNDFCYTITKAYCQSLPSKFIVSVLIKEAYDKGPKTLAEISKMIAKIQEDVGAKNLPIQEVVNFGKATLLNTNSMARNAGMILLKELYKYSGEGIKVLIGDVGGALQKTLEGELASVQVVHDAPKAKISMKGEALEESAKKAAQGGGILDSIPRSDISGEVAKLIPQINDKNQWKVRKDAVEKLDQLITAAKGRILSNGLAPLVGAMKSRLTDANKSVARSYIGFVGRFAEALGKDFKVFAKMLIGPMIMSLSDKQVMTKTEVLGSIDKMVGVIGFDAIYSIMLPSLATENPDLRVEVISWMLKNPDGFASADIKGNLQAILAAAQDKTKEVKSLADPLLEKCIEVIGPEPFKAALGDMKVAVAQLIRPIIEKHSPHEIDESEVGGRLAKNKSANALVSSMEEETEDPAPIKRSHTPTNDSSPPRSGKKEQNIPRREETGQDSPSFGKEKHDPRVNKFVMEYPSQPKANAPRDFSSGMNGFSSAAQKGLPATAQTRMIEEKPSQNLKRPAYNSHQVVYPFGTRAERDLAFGLWSLDELFDDQVELLREFIAQGFHPQTAAQMFSFETKKLLDASDSIKKAITSEWSNVAELVDLIVKWIFFRLMQNGSISSNCGILRTTFVLLERISKGGINLKTTINDEDSRILLSCLLRKTSSRSEGERAEASKCLKALSRIHSPEMLYQCIMKSLENENEAMIINGYLELLADLAKEERGAKAVDLKDIRIIAEFIQNPVTSVKQAAFGLLKTYYQIHGQKLLNVLKSLPIPQEKKEMILSVIFGTPTLETPKQTDSKMVIENQSESLNGKTTNPVQIGQVASPDRISFGPPGPQPIGGRVPGPIEVQSSPQGQLGQLNDIPQTSQSKKPSLESFRANLQHMIHGDGTMIFDSLMYIQDLIVINDDQYRTFIQANANQLMTALMAVMNRIFEKSRKDITSKYIQYYLNVLHRVCTCKFILSNVNPADLMNLLDELLKRLLSESESGDEATGTSKSDLDVHVKLLNSTILRVLENANSQVTFLVLIDLLIRHRRQTSFAKIIGLIVKCILKLTKVMESIINTLNKKELLIKLHDYLCEFAPDPSRPSDDIGIKTIKTILNEMIKFTGNDIWTAYAVIEQDGRPDHYLKRWITLILKPNQPSPSPKQADGSVNANGDHHSLQQQREKRVASSFGLPTAEDILKLMDKYRRADLSNTLETAQLDVTLTEIVRKQPNLPWKEFMKELPSEKQVHISQIVQSNSKSGEYLQKINEMKMKMNTYVNKN